MYIDQDYLEDDYGVDIVEAAASNDDDVVDTRLVKSACEYASSIANDHMNSIYSLPIADPSPAFLVKVGDIALYRLFSDRASEMVTSNHKEALRYFEQVASSKIILDGQVNVTQTSSKSLARSKVYTSSVLDKF